jgi:hypothetical protein
LNLSTLKSGIVARNVLLRANQNNPSSPGITRKGRIIMNKLEWIKNEHGDYYSKCGEYHIAVYENAPNGKFVAAYKKDTFHHYGTNKAYRAFGNSFIYNNTGKNEFQTVGEVKGKVQEYANKLN